ncbi:MAG: META domain-containing protein [Saprospiraceae bacterium]|nr:META domain-containing protein [Saprospiraceae bacterium]
MTRFFVFLIFLLCTACPNTTSLDISGQDWRLIRWTVSTLPEDINITATFADGRLSGKAVCNQYFADALVQKDSVLIKTVGATKMLCPEHSDVERQYLKYLQRASAYKINKDELALQCGDATLYFRPVPEE